MTSHLGVMILFAFLVSVVFATLMRDRPAQQMRLGAGLFGSLVVGAYVVGWLMYLGFR